MMTVANGQSVPRRRSISKRILASALVVVALVQLVVVPFLVKKGPSGDFMTIYRHTELMYKGEDIYRRGNGYLPGIYVFMGWQALVTPQVAWTLWRAGGALVGVGILWAGYRTLHRSHGPSLAILCLTNVALLSGFSPKWGNPGNLAALLIVLSYFVVCLDRRYLGGIALGLGCTLKYPLGLPLILLALLARDIRTAASAAITFTVLTLAGLGVLWGYGHAPGDVSRGVVTGIQRLGGYENRGFRRFTEENPHRVQFMHVSPVLSGYGLSREASNAVALGGAIVGACLACVCALKAKPGVLLPAYAVVAPVIILFTYHRFYDSGILAFPLILAWTSMKPGRAALPGVVVLTSIPVFLSFSNIMETRIGVPEWLAVSPLWSHVIGPHHVYAVLVMALCTVALVVKEWGDNRSTMG